MINRQDIVDAARSWIGTPFKKGGRDATGIDCVGLLILVGNSLGLNLEDTTAYSFDPQVKLMETFVFNQSIRRKTAPVRAGYIGIFKQSVFPMHTGIISLDKGQPMVINANMRKRKVVEEPLAGWMSDLIEYRDFKGVE